MPSRVEHKMLCSRSYRATPFPSYPWPEVVDPQESFPLVSTPFQLNLSASYQEPCKSLVCEKAGCRMRLRREVIGSY